MNLPRPTPAPTPTVPGQLEQAKHHLLELRHWAGTWWPMLAALAVALLAAWWSLTMARAAQRYRHGPGMATSRQVLAVGSRRALARAARYTRPGLRHPRRTREFRQVGARIGRIGGLRRRWFGMSHEDQLGVLAPTRQGKTRRVLARVIGDSPGTVVFASTKPDLYRLARKFLRGRSVYLLDCEALLPATLGQWSERHWTSWSPMPVQRAVLPIRWSPIYGCEQPAVAMRRGRAFVGEGDNSDATNAKFFAGSAAIALRCYLHAAALAGKSIGDVRRWASDRSDPEPLKILEHHRIAAPGWAADLRGQVAGKSADDVFKQLNLALEIFADPDVLTRACPARHEQFDIDAFLHSGQALFVLASEKATNSSAYTSAFVSELAERARDLALGFPHERFEPPISFTLDELTSTARLPDFDKLLADAGGRGLRIAWAAQGRSFLIDVWGQHGAQSILTNSTWKLVLQGLDDADYLAALERLAGTVEVPTAGRGLGATRTAPVMAAAEIHTQAPMTGTVWSAALRPFRCRLVDISHDRARRIRAVTPDRAMAAPPTPTWAAVDLDTDTAPVKEPAA